MSYQSKIARIRWFNDACYQIELSNGTSILVDPYIDSSPLKAVDSSVLERVDYILISHTHFDHVVDIKAIAEKFNSQIFVGKMGALELAKQYDLLGCQVNPCAPGELYYLDGCTLSCFSGKHTPIGEIDRPSRWPATVRLEGLDPNSTMLNMIGSYEYTIFLLELPEHMRILIWGGGATPHAVKQAEQFRPNITIAQLPRESADEVAELYAAFGGQVIFPHHHDSFMIKGPEGWEVINQVVEKTAERAPATQVVLPEKGRWYTFETTLF